MMTAQVRIASLAAAFVLVGAVAVLAEAPPAEQPAAQPAAADTVQNPAPASQAQAAQPAQTAEAAESQEQETGDETPPADEMAKLNTTKIDWYNRIRGIAVTSMANTPMKQYREGEEQLLKITDANALEPMALVLYNRYTRWRSTFLKVTRQYAQGGDKVAGPLAVAYLSDMALMDPSPALRGQARAAILNPDTPRLPDRLRYQLAASRDTEVRNRAAGMLADLKDEAMLGTMVDYLITDEWRLVSKMVEARSVQMDVRTTAAMPPDLSNTTQVQAAVPGGVATAQVTLPIVKVTSINTTVSAPAGYQIIYEWERVSVQHGGMLDSLRKLTRKDFGYDQAAWRKYLRQQGKASSTPRDPTSPYDVQWEE